MRGRLSTSPQQNGGGPEHSAGAGRRVRGDFSTRERAINTSAAGGPGQPTATIRHWTGWPPVPPGRRSPLRGDAALSMVVFGQVKETGAASLYLMKGPALWSRAPAGFDFKRHFVPEVPVKTRASTFPVLAFVISEMGGILCTHRPNTKSEMKTAVLGDRTITIKKSYSHSAPAGTGQAQARGGTTAFDVFRKYAGQRG